VYRSALLLLFATNTYTDLADMMRRPRATFSVPLKEELEAGEVN
jgi:hypothetical protein